MSLMSAVCRYKFSDIHANMITSLKICFVFDNCIGKQAKSKHRSECGLIEVYLLFPSAKNILRENWRVVVFHVFKQIVLIQYLF